MGTHGRTSGRAGYKAIARSKVSDMYRGDASLLARRYKRLGNMGRDNAHGGAAVGWARTGGEVERKGTHTAGQGSGGDRTWADGFIADFPARNPNGL